MSSKVELRKHFRKLRDSYSFEQIKEKSSDLFDMVIKSDEYINSKTIFCYISFDKEIDTHAFIKQALLDNKNLCVPVVVDKKNMIASKISSFNNLMINNYGILEPIVVEEIPKDKIDLIIVPGLCFRNDGHRVGYGAGYYDNYLNGYKGFSIGVTFKEFLTEF
ncbi:MAG TPA: 5-formyltetrahydrofolate cyclo-ligase, partial [Spirochaetota bacterium]|nr:5-formyltetrahydrofolate cyclo-ligase [Spirochaetota bacterium]